MYNSVDWNVPARRKFWPATSLTHTTQKQLLVVDVEAAKVPCRFWVTQSLTDSLTINVVKPSLKPRNSDSCSEEESEGIPECLTELFAATSIHKYI